MKLLNSILGIYGLGFSVNNGNSERNTLVGKKKAEDKKRLILFLALIAICAVSLFAQSDSTIPKLDTWAMKILNMFTSTWLKVVCVIALIALCLGLITVGRNEPGMAKKFIPWIVGVIILLSAGSIVGFFFQDTSGLTSIE